MLTAVMTASMVSASVVSALPLSTVVVVLPMSITLCTPILHRDKDHHHRDKHHLCQAHCALSDPCCGGMGSGAILENWAGA